MGYRIETITPKTITMDLCNKLGDLQGDIWGLSGLDKYPPWATLIIVNSGNFLTVAFDGKEPIGLALLQRSWDAERYEPYLYLSMIGVHPDHRNLGIAKHLMTEVKVAAIDNHYRSIKWTYDPLEAANANLYIRKLGARVHKYYENYYGELSGKDNGSETDRFWTELDLHAKPSADVPAELIIGMDHSVDAKEIVGTSSTIALEIPSDFVTLKSASPQRAEEIRMASRKIFKELFENDYEVRSFYRDGSQDFYVCAKRS